MRDEIREQILAGWRERVKKHIIDMGNTQIDSDALSNLEEHVRPEIEELKRSGDHPQAPEIILGSELVRTVEETVALSAVSEKEAVIMMPHSIFVVYLFGGLVLVSFVVYKENDEVYLLEPGDCIQLKLEEAFKLIFEAS